VSVLDWLEEAVETRRGAPPCVWYYLLLLMGEDAKRAWGRPVPRRLIAEALRAIVLWSLGNNGRGDVVALKPAYIRNAIVSYAREHRCYPYDVAASSPDVERRIRAHMRVIMSVVRLWVRHAPPCAPAASPGRCLRHLAVPRRWLKTFLSSRDALQAV